MNKSIKMFGVATLVAAALTMQVFAVGSTIDTAGGEGTSTVDITVEATKFSVTVPTTLALNMSEEGVVGVPSANQVAIQNNSYGAVQVTAVTLNGATPEDEDTPWTVEVYDTAATGLKINSQKIAMQLTPYFASDVSSDISLTGSAGTPIKTTQSGSTSTMDITETDEWVIEGKNGTNKVIQMKIDAYMSGSTEAVTDAHVADVIFTIDWVKDE